MARAKRGWAESDVVSYDISTSWGCSCASRYRRLRRTLNSGSWCPHFRRQDRDPRGHTQRRLSPRRRVPIVRVPRRRGEAAVPLWRRARVVNAPARAACRNMVSSVRRHHAMRRPLEDTHAAAAERGGLCHSDAYQNISTKLCWRCAAGHEWDATPLHILHSRSWCPRCLGVATAEEMRELAAHHGGRLVSTRVGKSRTRLTFECARGHVFERTPDALRKGC